MNFISTNNFDKPDDQGHTSEYFTATNDAGQIIVQIIRSDRPSQRVIYFGMTTIPSKATMTRTTLSLTLFLRAKS